MHMKNFPQCAVPNPGVNLTDCGRIAKGKTEFGSHALGIRRSSRHKRIFGIVRQRFFAEYMLTRLNRRQTEWQVRVGGRANIHHLDIGVRQQISSIGVDLLDAKHLRHRLGAFWDDITNSHQFCTVIGGIARQVGFFCPSVCAQHPHAQSFLTHGNSFPILLMYASSSS